LRLLRGLNFSVRMGINSGEVVVGKIGDDLRMDCTAQGHSVGIAARMEQLAEAGCCYLTEKTANLVTGFFELRDLGSTHVKGLEHPLRIFELMGRSGLRTRFDVSRLRGLSPFVGRQEEMGVLDRALEAAMDGHGQVIGISADAGVGKSRLCFEFLVRCRSRGIKTREAHALPHGKSTPLLPVLQMFRSIFGITERDSAEVARQKITGAALLLDPDLKEELPILFEFLGVQDDDHVREPLAAGTRQHRLLALVKRLIEARSEHGPTVYLLEDLHFVDTASLAFIAEFVRTAAHTRALVLATFRPEFLAAWMRDGVYRQLELLPLDDASGLSMLGQILGDDPSVTGLQQTILDHTGGNPLFMEELTRALVESGQLQGETENYRLVTRLDHVVVPDSVQTVIAARMQTAAVIGKAFSTRLLEGIVDVPKVELEAILETLCENRFIRQAADHPVEEYAFVHALIRDVAYASQLGERRQCVHAAIAQVVEDFQKDRLDQNATLLAHHAEAAGRMTEAATWHRRAAEWLANTDVSESHRHWRTALALLGDAPESREKEQIGLAARIALMKLSWAGGGAAQTRLRELSSHWRR